MLFLCACACVAANTQYFISMHIYSVCLEREEGLFIRQMQFCALITNDTEVLL